MSVEAFTWALRVPVGGNMKVVLLGLANHAHPDGTESYPALDTLAEYAACDRSTARRNVRKLVAAGWAIEDGLGPKGQTKYRLPIGADPRGSKTQPVASEPVGGGADASGGVAPVPPEPSIEPSGTVQGSNARADEKIPADFPDELRPHARAAMRVLLDVAAARNAKTISARALAQTIMARPRKPIVKAAHDCAAWIYDHPSTPCRDVLARYRRWLDREDDLASVELLPGEGPSSMPENVTPLRRNATEQERRRARQEDRARRAAGIVEGGPPQIGSGS